jgi:SAM-dependent methyltransferase
MKKSYHDYVIKDGQFIGDFENMYRDCEDPWMQTSQPNKYSRSAGIWHLKNFGIQSVLECGCGLGYYADWIRKETGIIPKSVDISEEAVKKAKSLFPDLDFEVADITKELSKYKDYECILFAEIIWYILPNLDALFEVMERDFKGKYLMVVQVFYKGTQKYGTEYFTSISEFVDYVPFKLVASCEATLESDSTIETSTLFRIE